MLNDSSMKFDAAIRHGFSRAAASYDTHAAVQRAVVETMVEILSPYLPPSSCVLDAGCGTGYFASIAPQDDIQQIDGAFGMARAAAGNGHPAYCADMRALPFANACFDGYVSSLCLQWITPPDAVFRECHRVLKPGGFALFSTLGSRTLKELRHAFEAAGRPAHVNDFASPHTLEEAIDRSGLRLLLFKQEMRHLYFDTPRALLHHLKGLGATYKAAGGGLRGRHYLQPLEDRLQKEWGREIPASFEVFYCLMEKMS